MKLPPALFALALSTAALAQEPAPPAGAPAEERAPIVSVELQCFTLPQTQALPLIARLRSPKPAEGAAALAEIATMLEKGTAKLIAWPTVTTRAGQHATAEQVEEIRYPTEFAAGSASIYLTDNDGTVTKQPNRVRGADIQPVANAFDTRKLGLTLDVEPEVSGTHITIPFKAEHVLLKSIDRWAIEHEYTTEKKTEKIIQEQPRFTVYSAQNLTLLQSGEHKLVGVFKTGDAEPTLELFILGAEILEKK